MHRVIAREKIRTARRRQLGKKETKRHPVAWPPPLTSHPHSKIKKKDRDKKVKKERDEAALPHNKREEEEEKNNFPSKSCSQHSLSSQSSNLFFFSLQAMTQP
jgi:hypothetical protein